MTLHLGKGLSFPDEAVTQSFAVLAVRGAGKSSASVSMAEEMYKVGLPWVAVDPKGDWHGMRSSRDGTKPGLPVPVFGGLHGDLPLEQEAGHLIADLIVHENLTCVLDVSEFPSKAAQVRFLTDLADRLFRLHGKSPQPRHVFLEEADEIVPQRVMANMARCVGAWSKLVKQGRSRGLGITLISQRSAVVNKDCLTQIETLVAMRTTSPQDRKAVLGWIDYHAVSKELVESLPSLADGEAWVISPHWLDRIERVRFRRRETFDSGSTPTMGKARQVATLADVDLGALRTEMASVVERAEANDPKALQRKVARLERDLAHARAEQTEVVREVEVQVPFTPPVVEELIRAASSVADTLTGEAKRLVELAVGAGEALTEDPAPQWKPSPPKPRPVRSPRATPAPVDSPDGEQPMGKAARKILGVLAQFPEGCSRPQVALLSGYSVKASTIPNAFTELRNRGYVYPGSPHKITDAGMAAVGPFEPLPSGRELFTYWSGRVGKAPKAVLSALVDAYPDALTTDELAERTGYSADASTIPNAMTKLRTLALVNGRAASDEFMQAIA